MPKTIVKTDRLMQPIAQFSFGMRAGDVVRIGATAGTDAARRMAGETPGLVDVAAQAARMLENFSISLQLLGANVADVVHIRSYLNDWRDQGVYDAALARQWPGCQACHSVVGSIGFPLPQAAVEAEVLAIVGSAPRAVHSSRLAAAASPGPAAGVRAGRRHFCAVGPSAPGMSPPADPVAQASLTLDHLEIALDAAGLSLRDVVMLNLHLADVRWLAAFDSVLQQRLPPPYPARTVSATSLLDPQWLCALESIAVEGGGVPIEPATNARTRPPASAAMLAGDELFIGGQLGVVHGAKDADVQAQTHAAWERITALLEAAGMSVDDVLHTTNTLTDWRSYREFNAGYGAHVTAPYPPRATIVAALPDPNARVMIEVQAHRAARDGACIGYAAPAG